jgi:phosphatidylserine synthase
VLDRHLRRVTTPTLDRIGGRLAELGLPAGAVTATGWFLGAGACAAAATATWPAALGLWLANRVVDGLDGPVARARQPTARGGFFDIVSDFSIYGGFVAGVAIAVPSARLACVVLLFTYYLSGSALLALSSLLERQQRANPPGAGESRSLHVTGGLAEGTETVIVYTLFCLLPGSAPQIAWGFAAAVAVTAIQRFLIGARLLKIQNPNPSPATPRGLARRP